MLTTLFAIAFAAAKAFAGRSPFAPATFAVLLVWAAFHVYTAVRLLLLERRCVRDRRAMTRFPESFPLTIARTGAPERRFTLEAVAASAGGFTLRAKDTVPPPPGEYRGTLELAGVRLPFVLHMRERGGGGAVTWADGAARATVDLLLHERAIDRLAAADPGDRGGLFYWLGISRRRYPTPHPNHASQTP